MWHPRTRVCWQTTEQEESKYSPWAMCPPDRRHTSLPSQTPTGTRGSWCSRNRTPHYAASITPSARRLSRRWPRSFAFNAAIKCRHVPLNIKREKAFFSGMLWSESAVNDTPQTSGSPFFFYTVFCSCSYCATKCSTAEPHFWSTVKNSFKNIEI